MCGLVGVLGFGERSRSLAADVERMRDRLIHRGPDDAGLWFDNDAGIALGHRRLSILDLSPQGHQPMVSACGRYVIVFNGEIYNFRQLRLELEKAHMAPAWRGTSDTEVLLACIAQWGVEQALPRLNGMFAFAVWDRDMRTLHLARDQFGEKPLYYGRIGGKFMFGSELKALRACPGFDADIDRQALSIYLRYVYIPAPHTIYAGFHKLPPGHHLKISGRAEELPEPIPYWNPAAMVSAGGDDNSSEEEWLDQLDSVLRDAVRLRMVADVPLGAFLSGGIDSTTVVALMQAQSTRPVRTFTIGNHLEAYDEAHHARAIARQLGTDHTELYVSANDAISIIPKLPTLYDEPFADSSQIPTFLVSELTRRHVTVSLSGDGGDELFGGYNRYFYGRAVGRLIGLIPGGLRNLASSALTLLPPAQWDCFVGALRWGLPAELANGPAGDKLHKLAGALRAHTTGDLYQSLLSEWPHPEQLIVGGKGNPGLGIEAPAAVTDVAQRMMYVDTLRYLPDDILAKVDRATMGVSLEARVPFLDPRVAELAWRMPMRLKVQGRQGKLILRRLLDRYVPRSLMERPKQGFGIPIGQWLKGELKDWAEQLLDERRLREEGIFHPEPIRAVWQQHLRGERNSEHRLWAVLMFQAWLAERA